MKEFFDPQCKLKTEPDTSAFDSSTLKTPHLEKNNGNNFVNEFQTLKRIRSSSNEKSNPTLKKFQDSSKRILTTESSDKDFIDE